MTITQLEYIVALDTYRSFVAAADKCFITQPTLSMQVQKLEESLGVKIFDRSKQPVIPTDIGSEIIARARLLLAESEKIKEVITDGQSELAGELKIGVIPSVAPFIIPEVFQSFGGKYPQVKAEIFELLNDEIIIRLKTGKIDCGIIAMPLYDANLTEVPLYYESFVAYTAKGSKLYKKKHITPGDIDVEELWLPEDGDALRGQVLNICGHHSAPRGLRHFQYHTANIEAFKRMVDYYGGTTILPELATGGISDKHLEKLRYFKSPEPAREVRLVILKSFTKRRLIEALKNEILDLLPKRIKSKKKKEIIKI